jgi:glycosyltransferase involved in cell wall biosynthesis
MRILGYISSFDELSTTEIQLGRKSAGYGMVSALLEYSHFDEIHFFLPFPTALDYFHQGYASWLEDPSIKSKVRFIQAAGLPAATSQFEYEALHAAAVDNYLPELCHLRNRHASNAFPVTFTPHSLSYWSSQLSRPYQVLPGIQPYDSIFCTSNAAREYYLTCFKTVADNLRILGTEKAGYAGRLDICPLGVRLTDFPDQSKTESREQLNLPTNRFTLLCLGRLTPADKYDLVPLLGVLGLLNQRFPVDLILAGAQWQGYGRYLHDVARSMGLAEHVHLFIDFSAEMKARLLAAADIFVSPADNLQETFGINIIEAMAAGLPVVAGDYSGYRDLVISGLTGFLIPTLGPSRLDSLDAAWPIMINYMSGFEMAQRTVVDLDRLTACLDTLIQSSELRTKMGRAGRDRIRDIFDWPVVIAKMEALWTELKRDADRLGLSRSEPDILGFGRKDTFRHFPSEYLEPDTMIAVGPLASDFNSGFWGTRHLMNLVQNTPIPDLQRVLSEIKQKGGHIRYGELNEDLKSDLVPGRIEYAVLWGLKYGVLSRTQ